MRTLRGFTLVEVLVAMAIMALLSTLAWQAVDAMVRSQERVSTSTDRLQRLSAAIAQWEADLSALHDATPLPALSFEGARLRLVRARAEGLQVVAWSLQNGVWRRWAGNPTALEAELVSQWRVAGSLQGTEAGQVTLAEGVQGWQLYFFRGGAWANAQSAGDLAFSITPPAGGASAPTARPREKLPTGVRLVLSLPGTAGSDGAPHTLTREVLVAGATP